MNPPMGMQVSREFEDAVTVGVLHHSAIGDIASGSRRGNGWDSNDITSVIGSQATGISTCNGRIGLNPGAVTETFFSCKTGNTTIGECDGITAYAGKTKDTDMVSYVEIGRNCPRGRKADSGY